MATALGTESSRIAVWSADYTRTTGQAIVTRRVVQEVLPRLGGLCEYVYQPSGSLSALKSWLKAWARLWWDLAGSKINTVYLVCSRSNVGFIRDVPAILAASLGVRVVVHAHGSDLVALLSSRWLSPIAKVFYAQCEVIVPSSHLVQFLDGKVQSLHVCENFSSVLSTDRGVDKSSDLKPFMVLWNSNVMASKGAFDVIEAVGILYDEGAAIQLEMIGAILGDDELSEIEAREKFYALAQSDWLTYHGPVSAERALQFVDEAAVVALPSRYSSECQPLAVVQAMCAGKAIVVSDIPALRTTLGAYPAEFVPVRSVQAVAQAFRKLISEQYADPTSFAERRKSSAYASRERFSERRFDQEILAILAG